MTKPPLSKIDVSVVVPAYRAVGFIQRAIESVLSQQGQAVEVIVVDDACPMETGKSVKEQYRDNPTVRVIVLPDNRGPAAARNVGFAEARGQWIAILDADDAFEVGRLTQLVNLGRSLKADIIADNVRFYDANRHILSEPKINSITKPTMLDIYSFVAGSRPDTGDLDFGLLKPLFRKEFLTAVKVAYPEGIRHGEDFHFYFQLIQKGGRFFIVPEAGYFWTLRSSGQSQTQVDYQSQVDDTLALTKLPHIAGDAQLVALLERRCAGLARRQNRSFYLGAIHSRNYISAALQIARHPHLLRDLVQSISLRLGAIR